jgi:site-specific recombinase XerD
MAKQLSMFAELDKKEPSEDTARTRWDKRLGNFENWLRSINKAERTIQGYTTDVRQLLDFLEKEDRLDEAIATDDLIAFLAELQKAGSKSRTLDRKRAALKSFFGYLVHFKIIREDPSRMLGAPIDDYKLPPTLLEGEVKALLQAARGHPRDLAILHLFADCGLRVGELCDLERNDIDLEEAILFVKGRFVPLPTDAKAALEAWLDETDSDQPFPITTRAVRLLVKKYASAAGIRKPVRPSILRHTFGVLSLMRGMDYNTLKLTLGHEIDDVMQLYARRARHLQGLRQMTLDRH